MSRYLLFLLLLKINIVLSQSSEGEIEDAQILIEKNSNIILPKVDKLIQKINLENKLIEKKSFEFENISFKPILSNKKIDKILRDNSSFENQNDVFIDIRGGNYSTLIFNTNPFFRSGNTFAIYSDLYLKLNSEGSKLSKVSGEEINDINVFADYKFSPNSKVSSHLNFSSYSNGYFGFVNTENIELTDNIIEKLRFSNNSYYYNLNWENVGKKYSSNVNYSGNIFRNLFYSESDQMLSGNIKLSSSKSLLSFQPFFNYYDILEINRFDVNEIKLNFSQLDLPLIYDFDVKNFSLRLNAFYQILSKNFKSKTTKSSFSPKLKLKYYNENLTLNFIASRGYSFNKYSEILKSMPFIYNHGVINQFDLNREFYRLKFGIDFNLFGNSSISASYESVKQQGGLDFRPYLGQDLPSNIKVPMYLYTLNRNNDIEINNYLSILYNGSISKNIQSSFHFLYSIYENADVFQPIYIFDIENTYSVDDFSFSLGGNFELENYGMDFSGNLIKLKSFIDIYINSTYFLSKNIELNFSLNNILNRYNERFYMYPELGTNFLLGVKWTL